MGETTVTPPPRNVAGPVTAAVLVAIALFALIGIGGPLVGQGVFAGTDGLVQQDPYRSDGLADGPEQNTFVDDTFDSVIPNTLLFAESLRSGEIAGWNPYVLGGAPLGSIPNLALASPLTIPYYLLPGPLAPGYVKLVEIIVAAAGAFLFGRRVGLGRPAALVGGLVFAGSAFLVAWTNWPQTRTAAVIGFVFWAVELLVQRARALDVVWLAAAVAAMLFGGFPAVTGYTLFLAGIYLLVRVAAEHRAGRWQWDLRVVSGALIGLLAGIGVAAVQMLPFASSLSGSLVSGRGQTPADHLPVSALLTAVAPFSLGTVDPDRPPPFLLDQNMVEALSYVGAVALVLVVVAVASLRSGRRILPRATWVYLVVTVALTVIAMYGGGVLLAVLQQLPFLFSDNYVGRMRSVLGFLLAVLAATGFEVVLRGRSSAEQAPRAVLGYQVLVWVAVAAAGGWVWSGARDVARAADSAANDDVGRLYLLDRQVLLSLVLVVLGLLGCAVLRWGAGKRVLRIAVAAALPVLITVQGLQLVREYWPRSDTSTFFPVTDVQRFLADNLGHERYAFALGAMGTGADVPLRLRALNGHNFVSKPMADLIEALPGQQFDVPPTLPVLTADPQVATSPVLDRLGVRYFAASPAAPVFGAPVIDPGDGSTSQLVPGVPVSIPVPAGAPLRAVGITPETPLPAPGYSVDVSLRTADGTVLADGRRIDDGITAGQVFTVPVDEVPTDRPVTATVTLAGPAPLTVAGRNGLPAVSTVRADGDGLKLAHAGGSVIYQRLTALPRIRWASRAVIEPDPARQVQMLASGGVGPQTVVLGAPGPAAGPGPATLDITDDGLDDIAVDVDAASPGYLVVADALQSGWTVQVDGRPAAVRPADHGVVAVAVPAGTHTVRWSYGSTPVTAGAWITALTVLALVAVVAVEVRRRRGGGSGQPARYPRSARPGRRGGHRSRIPSS